MDRKIIRLNQIRLPFNHSESDLEKAIIKKLHAARNDIHAFRISRRSLDTRKNTLLAVYSVDVELDNSRKYLTLYNTSPDIFEYNEVPYVFPVHHKTTCVRPVIAGAGPAGLFCALVLAENGYRPLVVERGQRIEERTKTVDLFWKTGRLDPESNIQFGEGGAGTFSDGKLNTGIKDKSGRFKKVLSHFAEFGAPADILISAKPHIGTDFLKKAVIGMRRKIGILGGEIRFGSRLTGLTIDDNTLRAVEINHSETIDTSCLVLATGHSARDTYELLHAGGIAMEAKPFAVGVRIEHSQELIDRSQYRASYGKFTLPPAEYKLAAKTKDNRGVYTFCMCPGGYVVSASSEPGTCVTNGMSYYRRDSCNANAAILVNVGPGDFASPDPLAGTEFQRQLEKNAFLLGGGNYALPIQRWEDYLSGKASTCFGNVTPCVKGYTAFADLNNIFPDYINRGLKDGINAFGKLIKGFADADALLTGVESRSSSPVRIPRNDAFEANIGGIFPCGAGAGYAGGIMSAAIDGIRIAEAVAAAMERFEK
ncbi:MAG: hypothetical protein JW874_03495 [Spirochaetales bacterium]|nr:hypothetical protein [Spirochaetales bacterium]